MTKKEMIKSIVAANKRLQRLRKADLTDLQSYKLAQTEISRLYNQNPFNQIARKTLSTSAKQSFKEIKDAYKVAKKFVLETRETEVGYVKRKVRETERQLLISESDKKRAETFKEKFKVLPTANMYNILNSQQFSHLKSVFGDSDQIVKAIKEATSSGIEASTIKRRITSLLKYWQNSTPTDRDKQTLFALFSASDGVFENKQSDVLTENGIRDFEEGE